MTAVVLLRYNYFCSSQFLMVCEMLLCWFMGEYFFWEFWLLLLFYVHAMGFLLVCSYLLLCYDVRTCTMMLMCRVNKCYFVLKRFSSFTQAPLLARNHDVTYSSMYFGLKFSVKQRLILRAMKFGRSWFQNSSELQDLESCWKCPYQIANAPNSVLICQ